MKTSKFRATERVSFLAMCVLVLSGCASKMALEKKTEVAPGQDKPMGIFTLTTHNQYKPSFKPKVEIMRFVSESSGKSKSFVPATPREEPGGFCEYFVSIELEPGNYLFKDVRGAADQVFSRATFDFPVKAHFTLPGRSVVYLGHVEMVNRKRNKGEERSGSVIPLLDQWISGFGGGTFDVSISDRSEADIETFVRKYPSLKGIEIGKAIMQ